VYFVHIIMETYAGRTFTNESSAVKVQECSLEDVRVSISPLQEHVWRSGVIEKELVGKQGITKCQLSGITYRTGEKKGVLFVIKEDSFAVELLFESQSIPLKAHDP